MPRSFFLGSVRKLHRKLGDLWSFLSAVGAQIEEADQAGGYQVLLGSCRLLF